MVDRRRVEAVKTASLLPLPGRWRSPRPGGLGREPLLPLAMPKQKLQNLKAAAAMFAALFTQTGTPAG